MGRKKLEKKDNLINAVEEPMNDCLIEESVEEPIEEPIEPVEEQESGKLFNRSKSDQPVEAVKDIRIEKNSQMDALLNRIEDLENQLAKAKQTEKFVGVENLSKGKVWLPAPESRSGRKEDMNMGRFLKKQGEIVLIPAYWLMDYIANDANSFKWGDVRVNNKKARSISPALNIVDIDIPDSWEINSITEDEILSKSLNRSFDFYNFINEYKDKPFVLNRINGVLEEKINKEPETSAVIPLLGGYTDYIDKILNPEPVKSRDK
jgi:hypothetical protein